MGYLRFIYKHLHANRLRSFSTIIALSLCIFLVTTLRTVVAAVQWGLQSGSSSRLVVRSALGLTSSMPQTYKSRIATVPGVKGVSASTFFMGFQGSKPDWGSYFPNYAVDDDYFSLHPEIIVPPDQLEAYMRERRGAIIGEETAKKFNWKIGDVFHLESIIPPYRRPAGAFDFVVSGIYTSDDVRYPGTDRSMMFFHFKYLDDGIGQPVRTKTFSVALADPSQSGSVSTTIDQMFEGSEQPTRTETEAAFQAGLLSMAGNLALLLNSIGFVVAFTILLVTANTMSMAVRERRTEIAVLKTLGFTSSKVMAMIISEALLIGALGAGLGLVASFFAIRAMPKLPLVGGVFSQAPDFDLMLPMAQGMAAGLLLGFLAGFIPAIIAFRARITTLLRTV